MARTVGSIGKKTAQRVLSASLKLFAKSGYAAVSMREIAKEVGLQVGALYNHFPTKQSILHKLMIAHMEDLISAYQGQAGAGSPEEMLEGFARFHIRFHIDKPDEVFLAYMELRNLESENYREVMKLRQQYERYLRGILRDGVTAGAFEISDVPVTAMAIISMMTGVNTWFRYGGRLSVEEIEEIYVNMVLSVARNGLASGRRSNIEEFA